MVLDVLASQIPSSIGGVISLVVQVLIIWIVVMLADKVIAHEIEAKRSAILAFLAYFLSPLVLVFVTIPIPFVGLFAPLIVWVVLGELLLSGDRVSRLKVAAVAFVIYLLLNLVGIPGMIAAVIAV